MRNRLRASRYVSEPRILESNQKYLAFTYTKKKFRKIIAFLFTFSKICSFELIWKLWHNDENFDFISNEPFLLICSKMCYFELIWKLWQNNKNSSLVQMNIFFVHLF